MTTLLETKATKIGELVESFLTESTLIIFNDNVPDELHDIAVLHTKAELFASVQVGDSLVVGDRKYRITAVGTTANETLQSMGHCTLKFDGESTPELPGTIHVEENELPVPDIDMVIAFVRY
ncbi:PTS glucitol/sorbitol transporter subunit IIA [Brevibacillus laterosporus]|uniref:PTS glucitol/sorbitol transporter subunit IIA n=1 Tax=Brevibacillus laterosporus TaxID=1465 RepID=A0AAP8QG45_BRELA|nr:PTS glucitol/sorbitol transporter subunit IIA [Brevibacillus laterosporus]MCR8982054.1 PTS glucitol/sorbitol transporter subunit IIA [Brevibacillus laterosporus]MCZ0809209.1 PTS glucitol/sorbitol transporter subunit IIA [Brevibacillus laterosporus]MCZ0827600.1 PTS glucitol/sorbitol transporter subunit IIA [Brevibacillus laterosporus]MCZ0851524.1 PTS glucitol/sorbitol transporter subunit IIA [Brevibacillus laterosporus]PPB10652.1 PTS sorbitol transporter subunit IIA [Brevibacillus laterospor